MGNYPLRAASAWPPGSQTFFPDNAIRERDDAEFDELMQFIQQECINNYDDECAEKPDEMTEVTATDAPKKKRAKNQPTLSSV